MEINPPKKSTIPDKRLDPIQQPPNEMKTNCSLLTRLRLLSTSTSTSTPTLSLSSSRFRTSTLSPPPFTPPPSRPPFIFAKPRVSVSAMSSVPGSGGGDHSNNGGVVDFALSHSSSLKIRKGDITQWSVDGSSDAIVNAANERMLGGGGVDGAIHRAAGPELKEACYRVPEVSPGVRCPTGEARITPGFRLPASHVIHTVGPIYDVDKNPEASLKNAYRNSLLVAKDNNIQYIAFPAISCGVYGYPYDEAANIAISTVKEFADDFKEVYFVLFSDDVYEVWLEKANVILGK